MTNEDPKQRIERHPFRSRSVLQFETGEKMRRNAFIAMLGVFLLFGTAASSAAQVKKVEMHIAGYLCGN